MSDVLAVGAGGQCDAYPCPADVERPVTSAGHDVLGHSRYEVICIASELWGPGGWPPGTVRQDPVPVGEICAVSDEAEHADFRRHMLDCMAAVLNQSAGGAPSLLESRAAAEVTFDVHEELCGDANITQSQRSYEEKYEHHQI